MYRKVLLSGLCALCFMLAPLANAQVTVEGRAFGSSVTLLDTEVASTADTGPQSASCSGLDCSDNTFDATASGASIDASPVVQVVSSSSSTSGLADDNPDFTENLSSVDSAAGNAVAIVLPGASGGENVLEASTSFATASVACGVVPVMDSALDVVTIAGTPVPVPGDSETTILPAEGLELLRFNVRTCETSADVTGTTGSITCTTEALRAQVLPDDGGTVDVGLSHASASLLDVPIECICPTAQDCFPCRNFTGSDLGASFLQNEGCPGPDAGDSLRFRADVVNGSLDTCDPLDVTLVARVPANAALDETTVTVGGETAEGTIADCPATLSFPGCPGEDPVDASRQCLSVALGAIAPGESVEVTFDGDVAAKDEVCLSAVLTAPIGDGNPRAIENLLVRVPDADCPGLGPGDPLATTGGGGCATVPGAGPGADDIAFAGLLLGWLVARRRSR